MSEDLLRLAERVEGLDGPDRETDLLIMCALDLRPDWLRSSKGHMWVDRWGDNPVARWCDERRKEGTGNPSVDDGLKFTASLDAAMALIEDGDEWSLSTIYNIARAEVGINRDHQTSWPGRGEHEGCNPILALLSAALRARVSIGKGE